MAENIPHQDDRFARESFSFRRMKQWQLWGVSLFAVVVVVLALIWSTSM
jgi:hypothetical protein